MKNLIIFLFTFLSVSTVSANNTWRVNWQHSKVTFKVPYMGVTNVDGAFSKFDGAFDFNEATKALDNVEFVISSKSIDTNNSKRDKHIRNADFFNVSKYPKISFNSTKTVYKNNKPVELIGSIKLLGVTKTISFNIDYKGSVQDPWDKTKVAQFFEATTVINRQDFGLSWNKELDKGGLLLGDEISIAITIEAFEDGVRPAFSRFYLPTNDIKKSVTNEIKADTKESNTTPTVTSEGSLSHSAPKVVSTPELPSGKDIALNIIFGFIAFVILIGGGIKLQITLTNFLEKKGLDPKWTFIIPNIIVMGLIMILATYLAPFMGYGPHPWGN